MLSRQLKGKAVEWVHLGEDIALVFRSANIGRDRVPIIYNVMDGFGWLLKLSFIQRYHYWIAITISLYMITFFFFFFNNYDRIIINNIHFMMIIFYHHDFINFQFDGYNLNKKILFNISRSIIPSLT